MMLCLVNIHVNTSTGTIVAKSGECNVLLKIAVNQIKIMFLLHLAVE